MRSVILRAATRILMPMMLLFSLFLLVRGHHLPGGGFVGGLMAGASFSLYTFAFGAGETRRLLRADPRALIGFGLLVALGSALVSIPELPFMTGVWGTPSIGGASGPKMGTPILFDTGIYLVVLGATLAMILPMAEEN